MTSQPDAVDVVTGAFDVVYPHPRPMTCPECDEGSVFRFEATSPGTMADLVRQALLDDHRGGLHRLPIEENRP